MPLSPGYYDAALARLQAARPITHRKMFGGAGFYLDGVFFGIADDDKVCFKVDSETRARYEDLGMGPWMMGGEVNDAYRELPSAILDDPEQLGGWIDEAVEVARRKANKK